MIKKENMDGDGTDSPALILIYIKLSFNSSLISLDFRDLP